MCTSAMIKSKEGNFYWARTMDFAVKYFENNGKLMYFPKNKTLDMLSGTVESKYSFFGMGVGDTFFLIDGINSEGLVGGALYLEEATSSSEETLIKKKRKKVILDEMISYFLAQCSTVEDVAYLASSLAVIDKSSKNSFVDKEGLIPLHLVFTDRSGKNIVLEAITNGEFKIYINTTGTLANSPTYDWHMTNLRNYVSLSDYTVPSLEIGDLVIDDIESGSGLVGLPGDYTSTSRFIRITLLKNMMIQPDDSNAISSLYTVFNSVIIPEGVEKDTATTYDSTTYWGGYDISSRELFMKPSHSLAFTRVSLNELEKKFGDQVAEIEIDASVNVFNSI